MLLFLRFKDAKRFISLCQNPSCGISVIAMLKFENWISGCEIFSNNSEVLTASN